MQPLEELLLKYEKQDEVTHQRLLAADGLLSYSANNRKLLEMHMDDSKTRLILGGKRSGKTTWGAVECCWAALGMHPFLEYPKPPILIRACTVDFTTGVQGIMLPTIKKWLPSYAIKHYWPEPRILELTNHTEFDFKSYDQDLEKFEGTERHVVWEDEEPPKEIHQSNFLRTVSAGINGKLLITCTPLHGMTWLYDDLYDNPKAVPPAVKWVHVRTDENPHVSVEAIEAVKSDPSMRDNLDAALYGEFIPKSGLIYKEFASENIIDPIRVTDDMMVVVGLDTHDRNPHGVAFCAINRENEHIIYDEIFQACIIEDLVKIIKDKLGTRWPPQMIVMDPSGNTVQATSGLSTRKILERYGLFIHDASRDVPAGRLRVSMMLGPYVNKKRSLFVTKNCHNTIREFKHYVWDDWRHKDKADPKEQPVKKDDHLLDAIRYICMLDIHYRHPQFKLELNPQFRKIQALKHTQNSGKKER